MAEPTRTPIDAGFVQRVAQGFRYALTGVTPTGWFSPSQPMQPVAQEEAKGRGWDYQSGYNLQITPRANEPIGFPTLRNLADGYDLLRLVIETRKDQLERLPWNVQFRDPKKTDDGEDRRIKEVKARLMRPDGRLTWRQWSRMALEDLLVIDAPTVYLRRTNGGGLYSCDLIDGATIAPKIDDTGRVPLTGVAYQQIIKGVPATDYDASELVYYPRNLRTNKVYGYSPVEQIITTVNIALRRQITQLNYFTEGNLPETLVSVPKEWNVDQIKQFDEHFNAMLEGKLNFKRRAFFVPDGTKPYQIKDSPLKDQFDDWLARIVCYAFSISPQALVQMQNRATAQVGADESAKEGLEPLKLWMADFVNECIYKGFGYDDIEFVWAEEEAIDPEKQARVYDIYLKAGVLKRNEVRVDIGRDPIDGLDDEPEEPEPQGKEEGDKEVGKSADAPFAKFLPATEALDASGAIDADHDRALLTEEDQQRIALAIAVLALLARWRKSTWAIIGFVAPFPDDDADLERWAKDYAARTMGFVNATTTDKVRAAVEEAKRVAAEAGMTAADTLGEVMAQVAKVFEQAKETRSNIIADTISTGAFGFAAMSAMQAAGVDENEWITERDERVRQTHAAMDGQRQPVGGFFISPSGAMARHPGGFGLAEEDVNCRCHLRPIVAQKADATANDFWAKREAERARGAKELAAVMRRIFAEQKAAVLAAIKKD